jgi:WD40 repeat protein
MKVHSKAIKTLLFMENNKLLTGSEDGLIKLIDLEK